MDWNEYQEFTQSTALYNTDVFAKTSVADVPLSFMYPLLALGEEIGEVQGKVAKFIRRRDTDIDKLRYLVLGELGDVLWQLSETARQLDFTLQEVMERNVEKLSDRKDRGVIIGEGDNR